MAEKSKGSKTQSNQNVDGFADSKGKGGADAPDPGTKSRIRPMGEKERVKAAKEIDKQGDSNKLKSKKAS